MRFAPWIAVLAVVSAGCASYGGTSLAPGASEAEVRGVMGAPALEMSDADGTRHRYYPRGPLGTQTFVADVAPNGALREIRQVLGDGVFNGIQPGMREDEVLRRIGPPREKAYFSNLKQTAWDYKFRDAWGYEAIFSVMIDTNGVVVSKFARRLEKYDRGF